MRRKTVRSGLRYILTGIVFIMLATFFHEEIARLLFLGLGGRSEVTFLGFFFGGVFGGFGVLIAALGFMQNGGDETGVRLGPTILLILGAIILFFYLAFSSFTHPAPSEPAPGESINI